MKRALPGAVLLALLCGCATSPPPPAPEPARERPPVVILTSALDEHHLPVDRIERVSMSQKTYVVWVQWLEEPHGSHLYYCEFIDGAGRFERSPETVKEHRGTKRTVVRYLFEPISAPGTWTIRIYLDGRLRAERTLEVVP